MAAISLKAGIATMCALWKHLCNFVGKHRTTILATCDQVAPTKTADLEAALDAIVAACPLVIFVCDAWQAAVHP